MSDSAVSLAPDTKGQNPAILVSSADNRPVLIDVGTVQADGGVDYVYWEEYPPIAELGWKAKDRVVDIYSRA